ncbi:MAG: glycoside hydrolase family 43 protein [Firmicutes bacterium]|nr:glycoside hydrolase family 43 protein [Bacillota bacterium]
MKLSEIYIRDPFILPYDGRYYLFGTPGQYSWAGQDGFYCHISDDLENWSEPIHCFEAPDGFWATEHYWAPEVHYYNGRFFMFASFFAKGHMRAVQVLAADKPEGPYEVWSCPLTPNDWMCLDGTLYVENGVPYMIFCHEWVQVSDGEMCIVRLTDDLKGTVGQPRVLFKASQTGWSSPKISGGLVTDGPYMHTCADGRLIMIWSSYDENGYVEAVAYSDNGSVNGEWKHCQKTMSSVNGGHGMIFKTFDGEMLFTMHHPNGPAGSERAAIMKLAEIPDEPFLKIVTK